MISLSMRESPSPLQNQDDPYMTTIQPTTSSTSFQSASNNSTGKMLYPVATKNNIGQTSTAYTLSRGVDNVGVEEVMQTSNEQPKVIHTVPIMTDTERDAAKKRIGSDLYEIFMRIQAELHLDNGLLKK